MSRFKDPIREGTMYHFMNNLEKTLIEDEHLMRLLVYLPMGYDEEKQQPILDPLDESLPDIVDGSDEYWKLVTDRIRKGDKNTDKSEDAKCLLYIREGRDRSIWGNALMVDQEFMISVLIHEDFEVDWRMSRIRDRIFELLIFKQQLAGFGRLESVGSDPREAPKFFRNMDYRFKFTNNKTIGSKRGF